MRSTRLWPALVICAGLAACSDRQAPTQPTLEPETPAALVAVSVSTLPRLHGVGDTTYLHLYATSHFFYDRNMLFLCGIHCVFLHQLHGLAAAYQFTRPSVQDFHDIAADLTFVYFVSICHDDSLLLSVTLSVFQSNFLFPFKRGMITYCHS